uniref:Acyl-CoA thioesterase 19 n=1 Tax=Amphiprion percula TaxID=161767 RepID=A0A3P8U0Y0_AMPPE
IIRIVRTEQTAGVYAPPLSVHPSRGLMDEKFIVLVQKVLPGCQLTVHALHQCEDGNSWEAFGHYTTDASGTVNGTCFTGYQSGWDILWELTISSPFRLRKKNVQTPMEVTISVYQGHQTEGFVDQVPLASVLVERWYMAPGVRRIPITEEGLTATLFLPAGPGPFPGVLDLWGGGGQLVEYRAALLASHGFASLALDYLTCKITLETGKMVDNQYFETAYRVLQQHPQVLGSRIAMLALSLGTSITLRMAVNSQVIKVTTAKTYFHILSIWKVTVFLEIHVNGSKTRFSEKNEVIWRDLLLPITTDPSFKVDMGRLQCPLMLVVGEDDQNWAAYDSAMDIKEMMERAGNSHLLTILSYPKTGHLIEPPYTPHFRASIFRKADTHEKIMVLWGGQTVEHSHAQEDAWKKMLVFLRENLYGGTNPGATLLSHL